MAGTRCIHIFLTELNGAPGDLSAINDRRAVEDLSVIRFADEADISPNGIGPYPVSLSRDCRNAFPFHDPISPAIRKRLFPLCP